jgi:hypothetical protein
VWRATGILLILTGSSRTAAAWTKKLVHIIYSTSENCEKEFEVDENREEK